MNIMEAIRARRSVRRYLDKPIEAEVIDALKAEIDACNEASGLNIQLVTDEPAAFSSKLAHYGSFRNANNYLAIVGPDNDMLDELSGYYGERIVLAAQMLGLSTCWVALTVSKGTVRSNIVINPSERLCIVISIGYGEASQGKRHRSKSYEQVTEVTGEAPEWFKQGVEAALLAPTAVNQQKFVFTYDNGKVTARAKRGPHSVIDLGIVKYHFEVGSGKEGMLSR